MAINRGAVGQQVMKPGLIKRLTKTSIKKNGKKSTTQSKKRKNRLY